jgi:hypothetical protein
MMAIQTNTCGVGRRQRARLARSATHWPAFVRDAPRPAPAAAARPPARATRASRPRALARRCSARVRGYQPRHLAKPMAVGLTRVGVADPTACFPGFYSVNGVACVACPAGSTSGFFGASTCTCNGGFAQAGTGASLVCTGAWLVRMRAPARQDAHRPSFGGWTACTAGTFAITGSPACSGT